MLRYTTLDEYWNVISYIHDKTKRFVLISEELNSPNYETYLQPMKEHRDAWDHVVRVYSSTGIDNGTEYQLNNMEKALGHEYRAFFDAADFLSIICRKRILDVLRSVKRKVIYEKLPEYDSYKHMFNELPMRIAEIRQHKDIGSGDVISLVDEYTTLLNSLYAITMQILDTFGAGF